MPHLRHFASLTLLSLLAISPLVVCAQQDAPPPPPDSSGFRSSSAPANPPGYSDDNWLPQGMDSLGGHASFHTDFTFNHQMLGLASDFYSDEQTQRIVANLRSISIHVFRFPEPGLYNPETLAYIRSQYNNRGWHHLVTAHSSPESDNPGSTDLWIRFAHTNVEGMVLLVSNPTNIDLIVINGTLSPLDLLHLRGHFGIPRFPGDQFVPDNGPSHNGSNPNGDH
ncbi:MAG TPA: hypothetical protein VME86_07755 [Acidobacteriaceae bacterium]|nr:hypothetical protein [Acidobacteriaceae bacterium]